VSTAHVAQTLGEIIGKAQAGEYARKGEHPVPSIDVHLAAGLALPINKRFVKVLAL